MYVLVCVTCHSHVHVFVRLPASMLLYVGVFVYKEKIERERGEQNTQVQSVLEMHEFHYWRMLRMLLIELPPHGTVSVSSHIAYMHLHIIACLVNFKYTYAQSV